MNHNNHGSDNGLNDLYDGKANIVFNYKNHRNHNNQRSRQSTNPMKITRKINPV